MSATSAAAWVNALLLGLTLWRRGHYRPSPAVASRLARIAVASAGLAGIVGLASRARPWLEGPTATVLAGLGVEHGTKEITLLAVTAAGGLAYVARAFATRAITLQELRRLVRRGG